MKLFNAALFAALAIPSALPAQPQIVINEIMQNPEFIGDTDGEWFEVYNAGEGPVDLNGWTIRDDGSNNHVINNGAPLVIESGAFLVLGRNMDPLINGNVPVDYAYGSSMTLGNGVDQIVLLDTEGTERDRVEYDDGNTFPDPSGASMELIHYRIDNSLGVHWLEAATAWDGHDRGTPGFPNSRLDTIPPSLLSVRTLSNVSLQVTFDEPVDESTAGDITHYFIAPGVGPPVSAVRDTSDRAVVHLVTAPLDAGVLYTLVISGVADPAGNAGGPDSLDFRVSSPAAEGSLLITEIMKDPLAVNDSDGEWFEVYNPGEEELDLSGWLVSDGASNSFTIAEGFVIPPQGFAVFTVNDDSATNGGLSGGLLYDWGSSGAFTLGNTADKIILTSDGIVIDSVSYSGGSGWPDPTGASMTLADFSLDNNDGQNWTTSTERQLQYHSGPGDLGSPGTMGSNQSPGTFSRISVSPDTVRLEALSGETVEGFFSILNTGTSPLSWELNVQSGDSCFWLSASPDDGTTDPGDTTSITVSALTEGLPPGIHMCGYLIASNDMKNPLLVLPVILTVSDTLLHGEIRIPEDYLPIPSQGDTVEFNVSVRNSSPSPRMTDLWIMLAIPGSTTGKELVHQDSLRLAHGDSLSKSKKLRIPEYGPPGTYALELHLGAYPDSTIVSDIFTFEKLPSADAGSTGLKTEGVPSVNFVSQNFPNPFNSSAVVRYGISEDTWVTITVYDLLGRVVRILVDEYRRAGYYSAYWNGDEKGGIAASGIYLCRVRAGTLDRTIRMILLK